MENVRLRKLIKLKSKWNGRYGARKLVAQPNFKQYKIFDENLVAIHLYQTHVMLDKPIAIGMSILDISKVLMYEFFYDNLKLNYGSNIQMLYTDTDSFILEVFTNCFYADMLKDIKNYDTSNFPENNKYGMPSANMKVPGVFKDELRGKIMTEFVGLRSKMYCVKTGKIEKMKKAKGVKKIVLEKSITFDHYIECIKENCTVYCNQNRIQSKNHEVFSINQSKIALSAKDNKRYILDDNIETLPWGHRLIPSSKNQ